MPAAGIALAHGAAGRSVSAACCRVILDNLRHSGYHYRRLLASSPPIGFLPSSKGITPPSRRAILMESPPRCGMGSVSGGDCAACLLRPAVPMGVGATARGT